jgi:hypothetical protein
MTNPYAAPEVTPELAQEERKRPKMWRSLLVAYGVHHGFALAGTFVGLLICPSEWGRVFPVNPLARLSSIAFTPVFNLLIIADPYIAGELLHVESYLALRWARTFLVLSIPIAGLAYALWRRRFALWYIAAISFLSFATHVITDVVSRTEVNERSGQRALLDESLQHE